MIDERYILMIHRHLRGELSGGEQQVLEDWLERDPAHRQALKEIEKTWQLSHQFRSGYQPDVAAGLRALRSRIQAEDPPLRDRSPGRIRTARFPYRIAAAILLFVTALGVWYVAFRPAPILTATTLAGQQQQIFLADGSSVTLNEHSTLNYPAFFRGSRDVALSGEAYFDVAHDQGQAFRIRTSQTQIQVLGTRFNLRAYENEDFTEVEVLEGSVLLADGRGEQSLELQGGKRGIFRHRQDSLLLDHPKTLNAAFWKEGRLRFRGHQVREAIEEISRRLHIRIDLEDDSAIMNCSLSGGIPLSHPDTVVAVLAGNFNAQWHKDPAGRYLLTGGSCAPE